MEMKQVIELINKLIIEISDIKKEITDIKGKKSYSSASNNFKDQVRKWTEKDVNLLKETNEVCMCCDFHNECIRMDESQNDVETYIIGKINSGDVDLIEISKQLRESLNIDKKKCRIEKDTVSGLLFMIDEFIKLKDREKAVNEQHKK